MAAYGDAIIRHRLAVAAASCAAAFALVAALVTSGWSRLVDVDLTWSDRAYAFTLDHDAFEQLSRG